MAEPARSDAYNIIFDREIDRELWVSFLDKYLAPRYAFNHDLGSFARFVLWNAERIGWSEAHGRHLIYNHKGDRIASLAQCIVWSQFRD